MGQERSSLVAVFSFCDVDLYLLQHQNLHLLVQLAEVNCSWKSTAEGRRRRYPFLSLVEVVVVLLIPQKYQAWSSLWDCLEFSMINSLLLLGRWKQLISSISPASHSISVICVDPCYTKLLWWIVNMMWMFCRSLQSKCLSPC